MMWRRLGCPTSPLAGAVLALIIGVLGFFMSRPVMKHTFPTWTDTAQAWTGGLTYVLPIVSAMAAFTLSQLFHTDSIVGLGLGARKSGVITWQVAISWAVTCALAYSLGLLPLTVASALHGAVPSSMIWKLLIPAVIVSWLAIFAAACVGSAIGLATKDLPSAVSVVGGVVPYLLLGLAGYGFGDRLWAVVPDAQLFYYEDWYSAPRRYLVLIITSLVVATIFLLLGIKFSERPLVMPKGTLVAGLSVIGVLFAGSIFTGGNFKVFATQHVGTCKTIEGTSTSLCLAETNEPRREALEAQVQALYERWGTEVPVKQISDFALPRPANTDGVFLVSIDQSGMNAEYQLLADVLSGSFSCRGQKGEVFSHRATAISRWLKEVPLDPKYAGQDVVVDDSGQGGNDLVQPKSSNRIETYGESGEDHNTVAEMQQYIRANAQAIAQCEAPELPGNLEPQRLGQ